MSLKVGIVGWGTIGHSLGKVIGQDIPELELTAITECDREKTKDLPGGVALLSLDALIEAVDLVVECASGAVAGEVAEKALRKNKDVMLMSVGGLLGKSEAIFQLAREKQRKLYLPSGALAGLDGVKSASSGRIDSVTLTTRKPPRGLEGAPHLEKNKIDLSSLTEEKEVFSGSAEEAVRAFPKNINVSAVLSLAGVGAKKTRVRIIADPKVTCNSHKVEVVGEFGKLTTFTENVPAPGNPKTSFLAILSAIATLKAIASPVRIGT